MPSRHENQDSKLGNVLLRHKKKQLSNISPDVSQPAVEIELGTHLLTVQYATTGQSALPLKDWVDAWMVDW